MFTQIVDYFNQWRGLPNGKLSNRPCIQWRVCPKDILSSLIEMQDTYFAKRYDMLSIQSQCGVGPSKTSRSLLYLTCIFDKSMFDTFHNKAHAKPNSLCFKPQRISARRLKIDLIHLMQTKNL